MAQAGQAKTRVGTNSRRDSNGTDTLETKFIDSINGIPLPPQLVAELDDQDAVLGDQADQGDQADLGVDVVGEADGVHFIAQELIETRRTLSHLLRDPQMNMVLVFSRMKHSADRIARNLEQKGIRTATLHSNRSQNQRLKALLDLRESEPKPVAMARLIGSTSSSTRRFATISAGSRQGVRAGMAVRSPRDSRAA